MSVDFTLYCVFNQITKNFVFSCVFNRYLYEQIKNGGKKDFGVCFVSPSAISKDGRLEEFIKSDEASKAVANRLSKRKGNHIILMPYNSG